MPRKKIDQKKKVKRKLTQLQNQAALANLAKARAAKMAYYNLRKQGFTRENVYEAGNIISNAIERLSAFDPESNPAVSQLLYEIGGEFPSQEEIANMPQSEYFKYATSLRNYLGSPLSDEKSQKALQDRLISEIIGEKLTRRKGERRTNFLNRRQQFIKENEETASKAFKLYRQLESTHAGLILRGKISPEAYGSDNLITDLFDFIESEYDGDFDAARAYWEEQLENQYAWEEEYKSNFKGVEVTKFDWQGRESYASFLRRQH